MRCSLDGRRPFIPAKQWCDKSASTFGEKFPIAFPAKAGTHGRVASNFLSHRIAHKRDRSVQWNDGLRLPPEKRLGEPCRVLHTLECREIKRKGKGAVRMYVKSLELSRWSLSVFAQIVYAIIISRFSLTATFYTGVIK